MQKSSFTLSTRLLILSFLCCCTAHADIPPPQTRPFVLLVLGPPGSGQGVLAVKVAKGFSVPHISSADLINGLRDEECEIKQKAREYLQRTGSIPDTIISDLLYKRMTNEDCVRGVLLDGLPRTIEQAKEFTQRLGNLYHFHAIYINVPDKVLLDRASGRLICQHCGRVYHTELSPPTIPLKCDHCSSSLSLKEKMIVLQP